MTAFEGRDIISFGHEFGSEGHGNVLPLRPNAKSPPQR